jgi:4-oxalmesaconate hydratase
MIIDCHGHYTTVPSEMEAYRQAQIADVAAGNALHKGSIPISDDQIRESLEGAQIKMQRERGTDLTFFSPRASAMAHHLGNETASMYWAEHWNDLIYRVSKLYPDNFVPVCMLPQFPGQPPEHVIAELERCVNELGFVGCNLNPDPSGGMWTDPPLTDRWWYPVHEKLCELDVPAMIHVSQTRNANFHFTGAHYLNADTTAVMQCIQGDLFKDFPTLKFLIPHGGGAVPYHWGRYRGIAQDMGKPPLEEHLLRNIYFDTCVYHRPGMQVLIEVIPSENILFASEMVGAVRGIDPRTGHYYDDTKRYIDAIDLGEEQRQAIFEDNTRRVFSRFKPRGTQPAPSSSSPPAGPL